MAGLDNIKKYQAGQSVTPVEETPVETPAPPLAQAQIQMNAPKGSNIKGPIEMPVGNNDALVAKMQQFINERENPGFLGRIAEGLNAGVATTRGPDAFNKYKARKQAEEQQLLDYYQTLGAYQAADAQAKRNAEDYASKMGTTGGTTASGVGTTASGDMTYDGILVPDTVKARLRKDDVNYNKPILDDWLKTRTSRAIEKEYSAGMSQLVEVFGIGQMPLHMAEKYLMKRPDLQAVVNGKNVPLASVVNDAIKQDTAAATTPAAAQMGQAVKIASDLGIPIISGDRDWDKQYNLYLESKKPGYAGNPVAFPGTSAHQKGNAIDTLKNLPESDKAKLRAAGFKQTVANDPGHWELITTKGVEEPKAVAKPAIVPEAPLPTAPTSSLPAATNEPFKAAPNAAQIPGLTALNPAPAPAAPAPAAPAPAAPAPAAPAAPAPAAPAAPAPAAPAPAANIKSSQVMSGPPEPPNKANYMFVGGQSKYEADKAKYDEDVKVFNDTRKELAKSGIASIKEEADKFIARTDPDTLATRINDNDYLRNLIKQWGGNPNVAGVLNDPTFGNAVASAIQKGIRTPGGGISMPDVVEFIQKTRPGALKEEIEASKELMRLLGQRILDVVQQTKGSSSDKDWVAYTQIAGSADNGWDAIQRIQKYDEYRANKDKAERELFDKTYNGQTFDYNKHLADTEGKRKKLYQDYGNQIAEVNRTHYKFETTPPRPSGVPQGSMYNPKLKKWGWYDENKKWTTN